ncbi:probable ATP-dependent RNA helicase DDX4 [Lepeophtheirus salmonis]|uniref:RNA helicase n=1 Tax=Lepeophtheirus salmonis TaxID=72036 RepID=H9D2Z4_LEPSM|nr:probable ATP-dependent RNA helicase DDX4 [Lepeophtheirus salmonis]XP_040573714.1 probable ATP-dependent RNA helicase DDX4 [Lepeophtheirus salmonis]AFD54569.1 vasa [Lepeophtheirus salmonis]
MSDGGWGTDLHDGDSKKGNGDFKSDRPPRSKGCFNCGEEGHIASSCSQPQKSRRFGEDGKKNSSEGGDGVQREVYIPTEVEEDDLFSTSISSGINFDKYDSVQVDVKGTGDLPPKINCFSELNLRELLVRNIGLSGYKKPTPIQKTGIPLILAKRDIMACSQTGSGKTAAFLLPIIQFILQKGEFSSASSQQKPSCLIVAPTRELAIQIKDEARKFSKGSMIKSVVLYGGTSVGYQCSQIVRGVDILIATPGRLLDLVSKGAVSLDAVQFFVLDEADRMLDMGFLPEVKRIVSEGNMCCKTSRQTLMFSATFPYEVQSCAAEFLNDYVFVTVGIVGGVNTDVKQDFYQVEKFKKRQKLKDILDDVGTLKTLVFVETKKNTDFLASWLSENNVPTTSIHGDRLQSQREQALADFRSGKYPVLVSTAVAARGLDIKGVEHVVNYDLPKTVDEYVHRVGRTGRVGNKGKATSFYDGNEPMDRTLAHELLKVLREGDIEIPEWMQGDNSMDDNGASSGFESHTRSQPVASTSVINNEEEENWE